MKKSGFLCLAILLFFSVSVFSQDETSDERPVCAQPFSSKFDEFEFTDLESAKEKLDLFGLQIKNQNARAVIIGYGGKVAKANQGRSIASEVEDYLTKKFNFYQSVTISVWDGGHREKPSVELFIKPQSCSSDPEKTPTLNSDEVIYKEAAEFFPKDISQKSIAEMEKFATYEPDPQYPAAARAVRARGKVLLFVVVDEKGNVTKAQAIDGHPLLRQAAETGVKNWKYQTQIEENKPVKFGGKIIVDFDEISEKLEQTTDY